ncbi:Yip1 family protein [Phenylobacterium soli]|uniref:YIP1 family protein n=1 Tax=Phenylobacterium soli TaxID=2170551 RepID=A0A328AK28_9CAUL|nr:Yip1 family protein [Phenylobacterium soli]RAK55180.1 YIP1 family protein [Phenylobacterium soli]
MSAAEPFSKRGGVVTRVRGMLLRPALTWPEVEGEPATARGLMLGYVAPLAAIGPVCSALGLILFGPSIAGIHLKAQPLETIGGALIDYLLSLATAYLLALVISALGPLFGGRTDRIQALKLVAYSGTAVWLAGVFALYPTLGFPMAILGALYSLYALFLGLPRLMRAPGDRALTYFAVVILCTGALALFLRLVTGFMP